MSEFIPISTASKAPQLKLEDIGKSTGFLGLGRKVYLVYDTEKHVWGVKSLNIVQRLLRSVFGFYKETTKDVVRQKLTAQNTENLLTHSELTQRIEDIWKIKLPQKAPSTPARPTPPNAASPSMPKYDTSTNKFTRLDPQSVAMMNTYTKALNPDDSKNVQNACQFGDWQAMGYEISTPLVNGKQLVKEGKPFKLLEKIATEVPELGNFAFLNVKGNGECGYRTVIDGLIHGNCILNNNIDGLKQSIEGAYNNLQTAWNTLPFDTSTPASSKHAEKNLFEKSKNEALAQLDRMKTMNQESKMALLQEEKPFLAPFLSLIRCLAVSQTKLLMSERIDDKVLANEKEAGEILDGFGFTESERKNLSYAVNNYSLEALLGNAELLDKAENPEKNALKGALQDLVKRANTQDPEALKKLGVLVNDRWELSNKQNIVTAAEAENMEMNAGTTDDFLKLKAFGDADSPRPLWATGSDFVAVGYALNKNICCIYKEQFKDDYAIQTTFRDRPADFYGLNMTGQVHYNALLPLQPR